jgi:hypothetical protein
MRYELFMTRTLAARRSGGLVTLAVASLIGVSVVLAAPAAASTENPSPKGDGFFVADVGEQPEPQAYIGAEDLPTALGPLPTFEFLDWASNVQKSFEGVDAFGSVEVGRDQNSAVVWWHGEPTPELVAQIDVAPAGVAIEVMPTAFLPGELRQMALEAISADMPEGVTVVTTEAKTDGSGVIVAVERDAAAQVSNEEIAATITTHARRGTAPTVEVIDSEGVTAAYGREDDPYRAGGSMYQSSSSRCSAGFAIIRAAAPQIQGMMSAAHCGSVGTNLAHSVSGTLYSYGSVASRVTARDGSIITGAGAYTDSVWFGTLAASSRYQIKGEPWAMPVGASICFSGGLSATVCSNTIESNTVNVNLGGDLAAVTSTRTINDYNTPAAGNGDSGGPGIILVAAPGGGAYLYPATIISAIPRDSPPVCTGTPGVAGETGRKCSPTVYSTSVAAISEASGFVIKHQ